MISVVTGYVSLPGHPRAEETYRRLGQKLLDIDIPIIFRDDRLENCWLWQYLQGRAGVTHSVADNPAKNSLEYHMVQAQKTEWLMDVAMASPDVKVLVWIDYGIFHIPGMTADIVKEFVERAVDEKSVAVPGCWSGDYIYDDRNPCWRFCGGVMVVPRTHAFMFNFAMKIEYMRWLEATNNVSWEVNCLARVEKDNKMSVPLRWYKADHNETMFTSYQPEECHAV